MIRSRKVTFLTDKRPLFVHRPSTSCSHHVASLRSKKNFNWEGLTVIGGFIHSFIDHGKKPEEEEQQGNFRRPSRWVPDTGSCKWQYFLLTLCYFLPAVKRLRSHWTSSPFGKMLEETGMVLSGGEEANELCECRLQCLIS